MEALIIAIAIVVGAYFIASAIEDGFDTLADVIEDATAPIEMINTMNVQGP